MDQRADGNQHSAGERLPLHHVGTGRHPVLALVMAAAFFAVYLANIGQQEFTNASEDVVIQPAMEARQGGPWWIPNMNGRPRILKPPLPTWIAAAGMSREMVAATRTGVMADREAAFRELAFEARWPSALTTALIVLGTWWLGSVIADGTVGIAAAAMCGSTVLLWRFGRMANTDVQLTLWVVLANGCMATALLRGKWWRGCIGAGVCLGLAMMSKGPVGLLQSVVPMAAFGVYRRLAGDEAERSTRVNLAAIAAGAATMLAIALPWPVSVILTIPNAVHLWVQDVFAPPGTEDRAGHWWGYVNLLPNLLPWVPLFVGGLCLPFLKRFQGRRAMMAWFLFVVPVIVMSFVRDKNERYGMPLVPAAAILSAFLAVAFARNRGSMTWSDRLAERLQWVAGFGMAGAVVAGAMCFHGTAPFYSWTVAIIGASAALTVMLVALVGRKRAPWLAVAGPAAMALIVYHVAMLGYSASAGGQSEFRPLAMRAQMDYPEADLLFYDGGLGRHVPTDLAIYAGHAVRSVKEDSLTQSSGHEQVLFAIQNADEPVRQFDGWTFVTSEVAAGRRGSVYARKP